MTKLPIVLCSGQLLTRRFWAPLEARNPDRAFVHADNRQDDSIAAMATRLLAEAPARFHLLAHAMGGFLAFEVMRRAADRLASLSLLATLATADGPAQLARRQSYIELVERGAFAQIVEERLPMLMAPEQRTGPVADAARMMAASTGADIFMRQQRAIIGRIDSRPSLPAITVPTLILRGDADGIVSAEETAIIAAGIRGSTAHTISGAGHLLLIEQPMTVAGWIEGHIGAAEAAA